MVYDATDQELAFGTVLDDIYGSVKSQAIRLAVLLQVPDLVKAGPKSVAELAQLTHTHQPSLYRLLYALVNCGYFAEVEPGVFAQSPLSSVLCADAPRSLHALATLQGENWQWLPLQHSLRCIQTGKEVFSEIFGKDYWSYLREDDPEAGKRFALAMRSVSAQDDLTIVQGYDFSAAGLIVDVGGGQGSLLMTLLQVYPTAQGLLFDQAAVAEQARQQPALTAFRTRLTITAGDFLSAVPPGGDIYLLKHVLHNWEDQECLCILTNCARAMGPESRLLIIDEVIVPGQQVPSTVALLDLLLHCILPGRKRSEAEHVALLEQAGLRLLRSHATPSDYALLEVEKQR